VTRHWPDISEHIHPAAPRARRGGRFDMRFRRHGGRTGIARQYVCYPYHFTKAFELDRHIPELLTLYQQSSSGGLYRGDSLTSDLIVETGAAVHITTQASTVVHDCQGSTAEASVRATVERDAFLAYTPDPLILFPGAKLGATTMVRMDSSAVVLLHDFFDRHDPKANGEQFDWIAARVEVRTLDGRTLVRDRMNLLGRDIASPQFSPMGRWRISGSLFLLGPASRLPTEQELLTASTAPGVLAGASALPNDAGLVVRMLADDAHAAQQAAARLFTLAVKSRFGAAPQPRRK